MIDLKKALHKATNVFALSFGGLTIIYLLVIVFILMSGWASAAEVHINTAEVPQMIKNVPYACGYYANGAPIKGRCESTKNVCYEIRTGKGYADGHFTEEAPLRHCLAKKKHHVVNDRKMICTFEAQKDNPNFADKFTCHNEEATCSGRHLPSSLAHPKYKSECHFNS